MKYPRPAIPTRRPHFDLESVRAPLFLRDNAILSTLVAALSSTFPPGEREFVRSVMLFADQLGDDPDLSQRVKAFARQEGQHSSAHVHANEWLDTLGFDATGCMATIAARIADHTAGASPAERLAVTVSLEHLTAVLAHHILSRPDLWESAPEPVRELLLWHGVEEIEHKSVAFDVYLRCVGDRNLLRRAFAWTTVEFVTTTARLQVRMLRTLGHRPSAREIGVATTFLLGPRGLIPSIARHYAEFYRRDFHPWDIDDRDLIEGWKSSRPQIANAA